MKSLIRILFVFLTCNLFAQDEEFASDRPGLSDTPDLINKKLQGDFAFGIDTIKSNANLYNKSNLTNENILQRLIKKGISCF
jgi:hypothetical protein